MSLRSKGCALFLCAYMPTAFSMTYVVRKGDTLSEIAQKHYQGGIYGKKGSLQKIIQINSSILNPNLIYPGQKIALFAQEEVALNNPTHDDLKSPAADSKEALKTESLNLKTEKGKWGSLDVHLYTNNLGIDSYDPSTETYGDIYSGLSYGALIRWGQVWNANFQSSLFLDINKINFVEPSNRSLDDKEFTLANFGAHVEYFFTKSFSVYERMAYGGQLYLNAESESSVRFDQGSALTNRLGLQYQWRLDFFNVELNAGLSSILPTSVDTYTSKTGVGYHGGLELGQNLNSDNIIKGGFGYESLNKDTSEIEQDHQSVSFFLGYEWRMD